MRHASIRSGKTTDRSRQGSGSACEKSPGTRGGGYLVRLVASGPGAGAFRYRFGYGCGRANSSGTDGRLARTGRQCPDTLRDRSGRPGLCWPVTENRNPPSRREAMSPRLESLRKVIVGFRAALEAFETDISRDAAIQLPLTPMTKSWQKTCIVGCLAIYRCSRCYSPDWKSETGQ